MSRLILFSIFISILNNGYTQFFYFQNSENVTLVNYSLENWRNLDENELVEYLDINGLVYLGQNERLTKKSIRCKKPNYPIDIVFEFVFENDAIIGLNKTIGFAVPNMVNITNPMDSEIFSELKNSSIVKDKQTLSVFNQYYNTQMRIKGDVFNRIDSNNVEIKFENYSREADYLIYRNASFTNSGISFDVILNEYIALPTQDYIIAGKNLQDFNTFDIEGMVNLFITDANLNGLKIIPGSINVEFSDLEEGILGLSYGINNDKVVVIKIDRDNWFLSSPAHRWYVLYHELGHDILNLEHGFGGKMMDPVSDLGYSWDEFWTARQDMFFYYLIR